MRSPRRSKLQNLLWLLLLAAVAGYKLWQELPRGDERGASSGPADTRPSAEPRESLPRGQYATLNGARLVDHVNNDGDSFHLAHEGRDYEFRLYFVDVPEKRRHGYNGDRIRQQGEYFGGLSEEQTVALGQEAKRFTTELLRSRPFVIQTRWQPVFDSGRYFAFVFFEEKDGSRVELSEKLAQAGLCRIYTEGADLPDGRTRQDFESHLRRLEAGAKKQKTGGWRY